MSNPIYRCDVVIVGGGPGGIAAAVTAAEAGTQTTVIDDGQFPGGQIWRNRGGIAESSLARHWLERLRAVSSKIQWIGHASVVAAPSPRTLLIENCAKPEKIEWKKLILATGARELFLPFPGWTLPGVMGVGSLQALVKQGLRVEGKQIVLAGSGPLLLAVAASLQDKGAIVSLILEQATPSQINRFAFSLLRHPQKLLQGILLRSKLGLGRYLADSYPTNVSPINTRLRVDYRCRHALRFAECDYFACGFNLIPNDELPRLLGCQFKNEGFVKTDSQLRTTETDIFAVGELTGIGGAEKAIVEGQIAAHSAMGDRRAADKLAGLYKSNLAFAQRLAETFSLRTEVTNLATPDTIICRCEDVRLFSILKSQGARDAKLQTRCGMGPCQARICGPILRHVLGTEPAIVRPPIFPTSISTMIDRPE